MTFLNRFYRPDESATSRMLADLTEDLVRRGWQVTVISSRWRYDAPEAGPLPARDTVEGVEVVRVVGGSAARRGLARRALASIGFLASALRALLTRPRPDVVVALTDPPFLPFVGLLAGSLRGVPVVSWSQDVYPEVAAALGFLDPDGMACRALSNLAGAIDRRAVRVVAIGDAMAERLRWRAGSEAHVVVIPNWADFDGIRPVPREGNPFRERHGLEDRFVVLYSGNAGRAHTFAEVIEAARIVEGSGAPVVWLFVGGGVRRDELREAAEAFDLGNVRFLDYQPREELAWSLGAADLSLVTEDPRVEGLLVPSKTYGILASGRPILYVGSPGSDVGRLVRENDCGVVVPPGRPKSVAELVLRLSGDPERVRAMGRRARAAGERSFDRATAMSRWSDLLEEVRLV